MGCTLVIDTSFGSTVGIVGREPIVETDSRTHVEKLQVNIARAVEEAGSPASDIATVIVGTGPAPFTGLRAGIVTAKALAFATGATLIGHNVLEPQVQWNLIRRGKAGTLDDTHKCHVLTLAVNDARRKQLYFALYSDPLVGDPDGETVATALIDMDIDYPASIAQRVNDAVHTYRDGLMPEDSNVDVVVDVVGHGARKYADVLGAIEQLGDITDESVLDRGEQGLAIFATDAELVANRNPDTPVEPLYLRRPDAEVPNPLKHVLGHAGADKA